MNLGLLVVQGVSVDPIGSIVALRNRFVLKGFTDPEILGFENQKSEKMSNVTKCDRQRSHGSQFGAVMSSSNEVSLDIFRATKENGSLDYRS